MAMLNPKYVEAIHWIANNDNFGDAEPAERLMNYLTVHMTADLFGVPREVVARDVCDHRNGTSRVEIARQWLALERRLASQQTTQQKP